MNQFDDVLSVVLMEKLRTVKFNTVPLQIACAFPCETELSRILLLRYFRNLFDDDRCRLHHVSY